MRIIVFGPGAPDPYDLNREMEAQKQVVEFTHLARSKGMPIALVLMYGDKPEGPQPSDYDVACRLAETSLKVGQAAGIIPTALPIYGKIPNGEKFAGRKYTLQVRLLDEVLMEIHAAKEAAAATNQG